MPEKKLKSEKRKADQLNWDRENTRKYGIKLHAVNDADIIAALDAAPSKQTLIKTALREHIAADKQKAGT